MCGASFLYQSKIGNPRFATAVDQQVGRLDVSMHDAQFMRRVQPLRDRDRQTGYLLKPQRTSCGQLRQGLSSRRIRFGRGAATAQRVDHAVQANPLDQSHRKKMDAAIFSHRVDRHDMRMFELSQCLSFIAKPRDLFAVEHRRQRQHLERHQSSDRNL